MADVANLTAFRLNLLWMRREHIRRMRKIMANTVIAERLTVTLVAGLFFSRSGVTMINRPPKIRVSGGRISYNDRRRYNRFIPAIHNRNRMT